MVEAAVVVIAIIIVAVLVHEERRRSCPVEHIIEASLPARAGSLLAGKTQLRYQVTAGECQAELQLHLRRNSVSSSPWLS